MTGYISNPVTKMTCNVLFFPVSKYGLIFLSEESLASWDCPADLRLYYAYMLGLHSSASQSSKELLNCHFFPWSFSSSYTVLKTAMENLPGLRIPCQYLLLLSCFS